MSDLESWKVLQIARVAHEANRSYCITQDDHSQRYWEDAPFWQQKSVLAGVLAVIEKPDLTPEESHLNWVRHKQADGWSWGKEKSAREKTHPAMLDWKDLDEETKTKDRLFLAIVRAMTSST